MLSWIGNVFICFGAWHVAHKRWWAFVFSLIGETLWIAYATVARQWSLVFICCVFAGLAGRNLWLWKKEDGNEVSTQ